MKIPNWAQDLTLSAILFLQSRGIKAELPEVVWRHSSSRYSSGHGGYGKVTVVAGTNRTDAKMTLLHEIAHTIAKPEDKPLSEKRQAEWAKRIGIEKARQLVSRRIWHTAEFWDIVWMLYREMGLPIRYCQHREYEYMKGASAGYKRNKMLAHNEGLH